MTIPFNKDIFTIISVVIAAISVCINICNFIANKYKAKSETQTRLVKIETDITYIRQSLERRELWEKDIEKRIRHLEDRSCE